MFTATYKPYRLVYGQQAVLFPMNEAKSLYKAVSFYVCFILRCTIYTQCTWNASGKYVWTLTSKCKVWHLLDEMKYVDTLKLVKGLI